MKFIHAADIHLDSPLRGLERYEGAPIDEIRGATRSAFENLIELAIEEEVDFVLLAGDLYDGEWKDYNTGLFFVNRMRRLEAKGIRVFLVAGNHDAASRITRKLRLPGNVTLFSTRKPESVTDEGLGLAVHGQGFARREVTEDLSAAYPEAVSSLFNIGLLHTCLDGKPGHAAYAPCTVDGLRSKGYHYWALGHVHNREVVSQDPWMVFPGNIQGRHARETGPKGCTLVAVEAEEIISVEHRELDVLRWSRCVLDISECTSADAAYDRVQGALQGVLDDAGGRAVAARLILRGSTPVHSVLRSDLKHWIQEYRALASGLGGAGLWLEKVILETRQPVAEQALLERDDALGGLLRAIDALEIDTSGLEQLAAEAAGLKKKLPPELLTGEERYDPDDAQHLAALLGDVKELLMYRLLSTGDL